MHQGLWAIRTSELLSKTASAEPTPGGGAIAAITGALGVGLMQMAVAITAGTELAQYDTRLAELEERIVPAADADVADFDLLMSAYRLPRSDDTEQQERRRAIETATIRAAERPLTLLAALVDAIELSHELEPGVKDTIVSDVIAGRDIVIGAARAAIRTIDINLAQLTQSGSAHAARLQETRDELTRRIQEAS